MLKLEMSKADSQPHCQSPLFSVVIPAYGAARYIADALDSVFAQTFKDYEVIVVNDGSADTVELEQELEPYMDRLIYLRQDNKGPAGARNTAIMSARGEYIAFLDGDDQWLPQHLAEMVDVLKSQPSLDLICADKVDFRYSEAGGGTYMEINPHVGTANFESLIDENCSVVLSSAVARRQAIIEAGLFDENFKYGEDFDLWLRLAYRGAEIDYLRRIHLRRRVHDGNLTADEISSFEGQARVLEKLIGQLTVPPSIKYKMKLAIERCHAQVALEKGKKKLAAGQYAQALEELQRANGFFRRRKLYLVVFLLRAAPELVRHFYLKRQRHIATAA